MSTASDGPQQQWGGGQPGSFPPPGPGYGQPPGYPPGAGGTNGVAIAALVLGLLSIPLGFIIVGGALGVIAVVLGLIGLSKARSLGGSGRGLAIGGIITGLIGIVIPVVIWIGLTGFLNSDRGQEVLDQIQSEVEADLSEAG